MRAIRLAAELVKKGGDKKAEEEGSCETREKAKEALRRQPVHYHSHGGPPYPSVYRISSTILLMWGPPGTHPPVPSVSVVHGSVVGPSTHVHLWARSRWAPRESRPCGTGGVRRVARWTRVLVSFVGGRRECVSA
jgi:hypothetical protein